MIQLQVRHQIFSVDVDIIKEKIPNSRLANLSTNDGHYDQEENTYVYNR